MKRLCIDRFLVGLVLCLLTSPAEAQPVSPPYGGTGCSNPATVADLADYAVDGALCQVQDGSSTSDCATGGGTSVVLCCYDGTSWAACGGSGGGGGGSGDVTDVGNCTTGACFTDGNTGTSLTVEGATVDGNEFTLQFPTDPAADYTATFPSETGTVCTTGSVCTGYEASNHQHTMGDATATSWFTGAGNGNALTFEGATSDSSETVLTTVDPTADRTISLPNETGTVCTTGSVCSGYGNFSGPGSSTNEALVVFNGSGGTTGKNSECIIEDVDEDGLGDRVSCPEGFTSDDQGCANNTDCNEFTIPYNDGGGTPTCTTMGVTNIHKFLPKSDGSVVLCSGTTEVGALAQAASGDVSDVGDCSTGACFTADGTGNSIAFEGSTADAYETTLTAADTTSSDKTITLPNETGTVCTTGSVCTGYQGTVAGLETIETPTNHSIPVANGTVYASKVVPDCDDTAGQHLNFDQGTQAFSCGTSGSGTAVKLYATDGVLNNGNYQVDFPAADFCRCWPFATPYQITDIDSIRMGTEVGDSLTACQLGIFSWDGATQYFEDDCVTNTASGGQKTHTNETASPSAMSAGKYQVCVAVDKGSAVLGSFNSGHNAPIPGFYYDTSCPSGVLPSTVTDGDAASWTFEQSTKSSPLGMVLYDE